MLLKFFRTIQSLVMTPALLLLFLAFITFWLLTVFNPPPPVIEWVDVPDPATLEYGYRSDGVLVFRVKEITP